MHLLQSPFGLVAEYAHPAETLSKYNYVVFNTIKCNMYFIGSNTLYYNDLKN